MKKALYIVLSALLVSACATMETPPLDDAYYWPDKAASSISEPAESDNSEPSGQGSSVEYLNVQDTIVTIRVKK